MFWLKLGSFERSFLKRGTRAQWFFGKIRLSPGPILLKPFKVTAPSRTDIGIVNSCGFLLIQKLATALCINLESVSNGAMKTWNKDCVFLYRKACNEHFAIFSECAWDGLVTSAGWNDSGLHCTSFPTCVCSSQLCILFHHIQVNKAKQFLLVT